MEKVLITLVTYNRRNCLSVLLEALKKQSVRPIGILIVDNNSTDDTNQFLIDSGFTKGTEYACLHKLQADSGIMQYYYRNTENVGGSGGFAKAIGLGLEIDSDYIWIMDDDVQPEPDCLENMLKYMNSNVKACIPNRTDENFIDHACSGIDMKSLRNFRITSRKEFYDLPLEKEFYSVKDMAFEGPLIATEVVRKVGHPNAGFFIEYDDTDYAQRVLEYTEIYFVTNACLHRQLARQAEANKIKDRRYNWRNYYSIRNNILFDHKYAQSWRAKHLSTGLLWIYHVMRSLYYRKPKNIYVINKAVHDGMHDVYGKTVNPGDL